MQVNELIERLSTLPQDATVYTRQDDPDIAAALVVEVTGAAVAISEVFGTAVILEMEEL
jgi:hypothetical protein